MQCTVCSLQLKTLQTVVTVVRKITQPLHKKIMQPHFFYFFSTFVTTFGKCNLTHLTTFYSVLWLLQCFVLRGVFVEVASFFLWRGCMIFLWRGYVSYSFWEISWFFCVERLHYFCVLRDCVICLTHSLPQVAWFNFCGEVASFFCGEVASIFFVERLRDFVFRKVAWFFVWRGCVIFLTHSGCRM